MTHFVPVSQRQPLRRERTLTLDELSEVFAEATGTTPGGIDRGSAALEIAFPEAARVVGFGDSGPLTGPKDVE